jgi:hypothetical protein
MPGLNDVRLISRRVALVAARIRRLLRHARGHGAAAPRSAHLGRPPVC